jgi:parvulin-like peptidyl-prolyl cis-trans isomerase-like protein
MKNLLREPLLHFLIAGAALFLLFGALGNDEDGDYTIVVDDSDIDLLINRWETQWKRYPTEAELQFLFDNFLQEEVYYREALNMSLDYNDEIIRRRMAQKMEFLTKDLAELSQPDDAALREYLRGNIDNYVLSPMVTFAQAYFSNDTRDDALGDASIMLENVRDRKPDPELFTEIGDKLSLQTYFEDSDYTFLLGQMGPHFADIIMQCKTAGWLESPVESGYGIHLVYVLEIMPGRTPDFEEVREKLMQDYKFELSQEYDASMFRSLVEKYDVILDFKEYSTLRNKLNLESEGLQKKLPN